ncbi:MAG: lipopolysaccharide biosynthesis protein [Bacteroidia bacterium]
MNPLKKLASQTAIYGLSSILGRLLNYLLVPLYTRVFTPEEYGIVTEMYAYVSFLIIILTYGMETAFFRFSQSQTNKENVYSTTLISILFTSALFIIIINIYAKPIASVIGYETKSVYINWFAWIIGLDAISAIPFAKLREQKKAKTFAALRLINIFVNIFFNLFFIVYLPQVINNSNHFLYHIAHKLYDSQMREGYVFVSNLIASAFTLLLLAPSVLKINWHFDVQLWKNMLRYALPLLIAGLAGMTNETMDRILIKYLLPKDISMVQLGIYGACYKVSILMTIFTQAFRFAAEPFFFAQEKESGSAQLYADVMKYFTMAGMIIFLAIMLFIEIVQQFIGEQYREGIGVVPILLLANVFFGMFFNLSIWYKLSGKTRYGAALSLFGAALTILLNILLIPLMGYMGAAWATLICYFSMLVASYIIGQKKYYIPYDVGRIALIILTAIAIYFISDLLKNVLSQALKYVFNTFLLILYLVLLFFLERLKKRNLATSETK